MARHRTTETALLLGLVLTLTVLAAAVRAIT